MASRNTGPETIIGSAVPALEPPAVAAHPVVAA